eukprot:scaffold72814_cov42-Phaeocystis_antarctica.AAC.2
MKHALDALASHSASCLPVWDSYQQRFVDVFTCTDLVDIVLFTHRTLAASAAATSGAGAVGQRGEAQQAIERCQLRDLHGLKRSKPSGFVMASVDDSMYHGCLMLKQHQLECLPLGDAACSSLPLTPTGARLRDRVARLQEWGAAALRREPRPGRAAALRGAAHDLARREPRRRPHAAVRGQV